MVVSLFQNWIEREGIHFNDEFNPLGFMPNGHRIWSRTVSSLTREFGDR